MKVPASGWTCTRRLEAPGEVIRRCWRNKRIRFGADYRSLADAPCHAFNVHTCCEVLIQFRQCIQRFNEAGYQDKTTELPWLGEGCQDP